MSIQSEIDRIISVKNALRTALKDKGATLTDGAVLADFVDAVNGLQIGGGSVELPTVSVTADKLLNGETAIDSNGNVVTGTIATVTLSRSEDVVSIGKGYTTGGSITIPSAVIFSNRIDIESGNTTSTSAKIRVNIGVDDEQGGYVPNDWAINTAVTINAAPAKEWTPGTSNQTLSKHRWLNGDQVIKGDSNLKAENIKSGISIFGIAGSYEGGSTCDHPEATFTIHQNVVSVTNGGLVAAGKEFHIPYGNADVSDGFIVTEAGYVEDATIPLPPATVDVDGGRFIVDAAGWISADTSLSVAESSITETDTDIVVGVGYIAEERVFSKALNCQHQEATITVNGNLVEISAGLVASNQTVTIPKATITETSEKVTIGVGYVSEVKEFSVSQGGGGSSITFGVVDENGNFQPLNGENVPPTAVGNPVTGEFYTFDTDRDQVAGTGGSGSFNLAKVTEFSPASGIVKGVLATGYANKQWSFDSAEKSFAEFENTPVLDCLYAVAGNSLIGSAIAYASDIPDLVFYAPLSSNMATALTGQTLSTYSDIEFATVDGVPCATFGGSQYIKSSDAGFPTGTAARTIAFKFRKSRGASGDITIVSYGIVADNKRYSLGLSGDSFEIWGRNNTTSFDYTFESEQWYNCVLTFSGSTEKLYVSGQLVDTKTHSGINTSLGELCIGACAGDYSDTFIGNIADVRVYSRVLTDSEIAQLVIK